METQASGTGDPNVRHQAVAIGKAILFGEHAVVYGQPALAAPVAAVSARAEVRPAQGEWIDARTFGRRYRLAQANERDPLALAFRLAVEYCGQRLRDLELIVESTIPVAAGLGSGAAVATAAVRAVAAHFDVKLTPEATATLTFESEKLLHGKPSGIDNTVIAYERPIVFVRGQAPEPLRVGRPFMLAIADSGVASPTRITVGDVAAAHAREPERYQTLFAEIGAVVVQARGVIEGGDPVLLGPLMDANQGLLEALGVSAEVNERLCAAARDAGALGAKLSGGGRGGNVIALVTPDTAATVAAALEAAGARRVLTTEVRPPAPG